MSVKMSDRAREIYERRESQPPQPDSDRKRRIQAMYFQLLVNRSHARAMMPQWDPEVVELVAAIDRDIDALKADHPDVAL